MFERFFGKLETFRDPFPSVAAERPPDTLWRFIVYHSKPFLPLIVACSTVASVVALLEVSLFAFLGRLVDWLQASERETFWSEHGGFLIFMGVVVVVVLPILKFLYEAIVHQGLMANFAMRARWQSHRYLLRQSMDFFQNDFAGRVATKVLQTSVSLREVVMKVTEVLVYVAVYFLGALAAFWSNDVRLMVPLLLWLGGYFLAMRYFVPRLGEISSRQADARSLMTGRIVDSYTNIATVKMFAHADREDSYARDSMSQFIDTVYEQMRMVTMLTVTLNVLNAALLASTTGVAVWLWSINEISTGAIALAMGLILRLQGMSHWILWEVAGLFENIGVVQDGIATISKPRSVVDKPGAKDLTVVEGGIVYDKISFNYGKTRDDGEAGVISDLSLTIAPGEKVGLVGRSGAGKSTMVSLLLRFHDLQSGRILIDGQDISEVGQESLRSAIAMVTQDTSLLHRSVLENIVYGRPTATHAEAEKAARRAAAHDFIAGLVDGKGRRGYDAHVGERGVKLSGGQRQRIAIARVLLKDAPILILDEATSALDSEVESVIQDQLMNLMENKTVIAIAHRLSTIAKMDRLVVMDQGRIVEEGTHESLLRSGGLYADLWRRQSGGFLGAEAAE